MYCILLLATGIYCAAWWSSCYQRSFLVFWLTISRVQVSQFVKVLLSEVFKQSVCLSKMLKCFFRSHVLCVSEGFMV